MNKLSYISAIIVTITLLGCGGSNSNSSNNQTAAKETTKAFFGDKANSRVVVVDVEEMKLTEPFHEVFTGHEITYTADKVYDNPKVYVINRGSNAVDVMDIDSIEITKTIELKHFPRSAESMNENLRLTEITGMDKPMASIVNIDTDEVIAVVGRDEKVDVDNNPNYGGSHASGHPFWINKNHFILLDRYHRKVITYNIGKNHNGKWVTSKIGEVSTGTSIHQIVPRRDNYRGDEDLYYGIAEGAKNIYPSVVEFKFTEGKGLTVNREVKLKKKGVDVNDMWLHHGDFNPNGKFLYVGSGDGTLFIVNYENMKINRTIKVGKGVGHTVMVAERNMGIVINHKDVFVSIIDIKSNKKIRDVKVSPHNEWVGIRSIQAHPRYYVSSDSRYFYAFLTEEGRIYKMDLETMEVVKILDVGGKPAQGTFVRY